MPDSTYQLVNWRGRSAEDKTEVDDGNALARGPEVYGSSPVRFACEAHAVRRRHSRGLRKRDCRCGQMQNVDGWSGCMMQSVDAEYGSEIADA
jgi:hypothetical protein